MSATRYYRFKTWLGVADLEFKRAIRKLASKSVNFLNPPVNSDLGFLRRRSEDFNCFAGANAIDVQPIGGGRFRSRPKVDGDVPTRGAVDGTEVTNPGDLSRKKGLLDRIPVEGGSALNPSNDLGKADADNLIRPSWSQRLLNFLSSSGLKLSLQEMNFCGLSFDRLPRSVQLRLENLALRLQNLVLRYLFKRAILFLERTNLIMEKYKLAGDNGDRLRLLNHIDDLHYEFYRSHFYDPRRVAKRRARAQAQAEVGCS
jgi:hypothetical protein